ncbi:MAG: Do family serine endopeptidase [Bacteroidales bacterium]|jgi:Do/DeqQ family serine protease
MKKNFYLYLFLTVLISGITSYAVFSLTDKSKSSSYVYEGESSLFHKANYVPDEFPDFTFAAENAVKAVVHVKVVKKGTTQPYSIFDFFFGYGPQQQPREQVGSGSGVIINPEGYIVTNNHVIDGADEIEVTLENNNVFKAKLVGADPVTDIALLKIEAKNLPYLKFGDSDSLRLGEWVLAIGNPYNLRSTITAGIVSAKARSMPSMSNEFKIESFIQTDAAVNSGNSGGALITTRGELVGINTAIASRTGDFAGYSFAVPTTIVKKVVDDLMDFGVVQRAMMGISMQDIDSKLANEKNLGNNDGVYIADVVKDSPADKAGVKPGDVLLSINGVKVTSSPAVQELVNRYRPKDKISVEIVRDGKQKDLSIVLEGRTDQIAMISDGQEGLLRLYGAEVRDASKDEIENLGINGGVRVIKVSAGKFMEAGIKEGFTITHINQVPVSSIEELQSVINRSRRSLLIEGVYPDGKVMYYGMGL